MSFLELREILQLEPSKEAWEKLTVLLDQWQGSDLELALEYAIEHTKCWDPDIKYLYLDNDKEIPKWIQVVTRSVYYTDNKALPEWLQNLTNLTNLYQIERKTHSSSQQAGLWMGYKRFLK